MFIMYSMRIHLTTVGDRRFLDDLGRGKLVGGDVLLDEMSKVEVAGAVFGISLAVPGSGEANVAAVVGTERKPQRVVDPFVARMAVVDVGDLRLLFEGDAGLTFVGSSLVSSSTDGKGLVDGLALKAGSFEPFIHEGSPGSAAVTSEDELSELVDGDGHHGTITVTVEFVHELGALLAGRVALSGEGVFPHDGRKHLLAEEEAIAEGDISHTLLIVVFIAGSSTGGSLDEAVYALVDEVVQVLATGAELDVAIFTIVLELVTDASGVQALSGDLYVDRK